MRSTRIILGFLFAGFRLLETNDPSGYEMMIACMGSKSHAFAVYACKAILEYCYRQQDQEKSNCGPKLWNKLFISKILINANEIK